MRIEPASVLVLSRLKASSQRSLSIRLLVFTGIVQMSTLQYSNQAFSENVFYTFLSNEVLFSTAVSRRVSLHTVYIYTPSAGRGRVLPCSKRWNVP